VGGGGGGARQVGWRATGREEGVSGNKYLGNVVYIDFFLVITKNTA
jgi:hypothetical protein